MRLADIYRVPVLLTEQYPQGLGETLSEIKELLPGMKPVEKTCCNCGDEAGFKKELEASGRKQVLVCGIESHICVYQTALDLLDLGYEVQVVADAVSSRTEANKKISLERMN